MELTTLSWMLLVSDVVGDSPGFFATLFVASIIFAIVRGIIVTLDKDFNEFKTLPMWVVVLLLGWGVPMVLTGLVPNSTVIMQVAAIELGDDVLNSAEFQRILNAYIPKE